MRCFIRSCCLTLMLVPASWADFVDFDTEIMPIFSKAGCNAAACHGGAAGRAGFRLSLFGGDPASDYRAVALDLEGRRVNQSDPHASLLLRKPTEELEHGGGEVLAHDGEAAATISHWISQGARRLQLRKLQSLSVEPSQIAFEKTPEVFHVCVQATFDDGLTRDVTRAATFAALDQSAITFDGAGSIRVVRPGRHCVVVGFAGQVVPVTITSPLGSFDGDYLAAARKNWIDDEILATLRQLRLPVSAQADDATFLRRVYLDLTGRLPTVEQTTIFLEDQDVRRRQKLVDRLLASDEFVEYWTFHFARLLRLQPPGGDRQAANRFYGWLAEHIRSDAPWNEMAGELILAEGDSHQYGAVTFHRLHANAREQSEYVTEVFLGVRMRCANCHNHPLDRWTQDDYHGLAQIFAPLERGRVVSASSRGEVMHPRTGRAAVPRIPGAYNLEIEHARTKLAAWLVDADNPYFARAMVGRIWRNLMGRGLVEPTDDLRDTNPASHPELLDELAAHFTAGGYRLRQVIRTICGSAAYARSSAATPENEVDDRFYAHALEKPLDAEVLADAIGDVTGIHEVYVREYPQTRAIALVDPGQATQLDLLGRCSRSTSCDVAARGARGIATKLHLLNGPLINERLASPDGRLAQLLAAGRSTREIVTEFYLRALCRQPTAAEMEYWENDIDTIAREVGRSEKLEDFVWSLLNCHHFVVNR